jgi:hypothetical protein
VDFMQAPKLGPYNPQVQGFLFNFLEYIASSYEIHALLDGAAGWAVGGGPALLSLTHAPIEPSQTTLAKGLGFTSGIIRAGIPGTIALSGSDIYGMHSPIFLER